MVTKFRDLARMWTLVSPHLRPQLSSEPYWTTPTNSFDPSSRNMRPKARKDTAGHPTPSNARIEGRSRYGKCKRWLLPITHGSSSEARCMVDILKVRLLLWWAGATIPADLSDHRQDFNELHGRYGYNLCEPIRSGGSGENRHSHAYFKFHCVQPPCIHHVSHWHTFRPKYELQVTECATQSRTGRA